MRSFLRETEEKVLIWKMCNFLYDLSVRCDYDGAIDVTYDCCLKHSDRTVCTENISLTLLIITITV